MFGYTKDFLPMHLGVNSIFLEDLCNILFDIEYHSKKTKDFDKFSAWDYRYNNEELKEIKQQIQEEIIKRILTNKGKRIETLKVNEKTLMDSVIERNITSTFFMSDTEIVDLGIEFGKTPYQIFSFIEKELK